MKSFRTLIALLALSILANGCATQLEAGKTAPLSGRLSGSVAYSERIALPPDARIIVNLEDVSRTDKSSAFIAQQTLQPRTQVPIAFDLRYIPASIDRSHRYAVRAVIMDSQNELLWASTEDYPVLFNEPEKPIAVTVQRVTNAAAAAVPPANTNMGFKCDDIEFIAKFGTDKVQIMLPARTLTLPHVISASGVRYTDGASTFWSKGKEALFEMNGVSYTGCKSDPLPVPSK